MASILHVDMDAFYASVEERDNPELRGKPVVVGGSRDHRGVVSAANYVARKYGIHSAQPASTAHRLCPHAIFLPPRIGHYAAISDQIREIFQRYTPLVEPLSLDEAFLDVTGSERLFGSPSEIGRQIKTVIKDELQLVASVGVAPNKFLAKVASDLDKPDGFVVVEPDRIQEFLDPLPVKRLWGVGKRAAELLSRLGIETVGQLGKLPVDALTDKFGKQGAHLWRLCRGIDQRRVTPDHAAKSISTETTFATDIAERDTLRACLIHQTEQVARRLRRHALHGKTVTIKVRFSDFRTFTRSTSLVDATNSTDDIWTAASHLFDHRFPQQAKPVRLLGVGISKLVAYGKSQQDLFDGDRQEKLSRLDSTTDAIQERFGTQKLSRALGMGQQHRRRPSD